MSDAQTQTQQQGAGQGPSPKPEAPEVKIDKLPEKLNELGKKIDELPKEVERKLSGWFTFIRRQTWAIILVLVAVVAYVFVFCHVIANLAESSQLSGSLILWHNLALLFFPTIAFVAIIWAIVKIFQSE